MRAQSTVLAKFEEKRLIKKCVATVECVRSPSFLPKNVTGLMEVKELLKCIPFYSRRWRAGEDAREAEETVFPVVRIIRSKWIVDSSLLSELGKMRNEESASKRDVGVLITSRQLPEIRICLITLFLHRRDIFPKSANC